MKIAKLLLSAAFTLFLLLFLNGNIKIPGLALPAIGKVLNPVNGLWANAEKNSSFSDYSISSEKLKDDITIVYDDRQVPHIYAENIEDALFAQGYVEARDRFFQLEFIQRFASGSLSEVLGGKTIQLDRAQRRKGIDYAAEKAVEGWKSFPEKLPMIESYIAGINHYANELNPAEYPVEFKLIGIEKSEWSLLKCARVSKWMSDVLCGRSMDIGNSNIKAELGEETYGLLFPEKPNNVDPVIPREKSYNFDKLKIEVGTGWDQSDTYDLQESPMSPPGIGSNNWAVSSKKSTTSAPIYASDPHLQLTLPSIWYEVAFHTPDFNAYGVSIPGMPGLMMGFNDSIAWGETNVAWDVKDYFEIKWKDKNNHIYELDGKDIKADLRVEEIKVKGADTFLDTVVYTSWGPIQYDDKDLAMRWLTHDTPETPDFFTFIGTMMAHNYDEFLENTSVFVTPAQNFGFASKNGDIGIRINGLFPANTFLDGKFVQDGSDSRNDWSSFIPRNQNPQILNPERGFIASANQRSTDDTYPYYYYGRFEHYRNRTLNELLSSKEKHSIEDMKSYHRSTHSKKAEEALPFFLNTIKKMELNAEERKYLKLLQNWNYAYEKESVAATVFEFLYAALRNNSLEELNEISKQKSISYPEPYAFLDLAENHPDHLIFDIDSTVEVEQFEDIMKISYKQVVVDLEEIIEENKPLEWGKHRPTSIYHLAQIPSFSEQGMEIGGHPNALNALGNTYGPSWRMIVSLEDKTNAYGVFPGGQSGNPFSKYYKTSMEKWKTGEYHKLELGTNPQDIKNPLFTIKMKGDAK